ncbi:MAG: WYL domain-containing protein, partial [Muribaculaceae bacterium]|nr:WYL domain-containing protein [Muribaculaceae bacterium]
VNAESREMPETMRQQLIASKVFTKKNQAAAISLLQHACSQRKRVVLHNYASSNSGKVADRTVEAYDVRPEDGLAICFDCKKLECSVFKINRIGYVEILDSEPWSHTAVHKKIDVDVFHMSGTKPVAVSLQLDLMAKNLLIEEFPSAKDCIKPHKGDNNIWYFDTQVYQMEGIGRFYLGLANHIKILQAPELEQYVATFVKENLKL